MLNDKTTKRVARFKKIAIGTKLDEKMQPKKDPRTFVTLRIWHEYFSHYTPLTKNDVVHYFRTIKPPGGKVGEFCERCGVLIGKDSKHEKEPCWFGTWCLCSGCYKKKTNNEIENTPDIEDVKRFGVILS